MRRPALQTVRQGTQAREVQLLVAPEKGGQWLEAVLLDGLDQHRVHAGDFGRGAERAVVHVASGASGDLRYLARRQGAWRAAVELAQRRKGDVAHVHVEEIGRASCRERGCQYV